MTFIFTAAVVLSAVAASLLTCQQFADWLGSQSDLQLVTPPNIPFTPVILCYPRANQASPCLASKIRKGWLQPLMCYILFSPATYPSTYCTRVLYLILEYCIWQFKYLRLLQHHSACFFHFMCREQSALILRNICNMNDGHWVSTLLLYWYRKSRIRTSAFRQFHINILVVFT